MPGKMYAQIDQKPLMLAEMETRCVAIGRISSMDDHALVLLLIAYCNTWIAHSAVAHLMFNTIPLFQINRRVSKL